MKNQGGMSLRDWFAGQALAGLMAHPGCHYDGARPQGCAEWAYQFADAMLAAREKKGEE